MPFKIVYSYFLFVDANFPIESPTDLSPFFFMFICFREGDAGIVKYLLNKYSQLWNTCSKNGRTPLHTAGNKYLKME